MIRLDIEIVGLINYKMRWRLLNQSIINQSIINQSINKNIMNSNKK